MTDGGLSCTALTSLAVLSVEHVVSVALGRYTQQRPVVGARAAPSVAVLLGEIVKLVLSVTLELGHWGGLGAGATRAELTKATVGSPRDTLRLGVPALLWTLQNNIIYVALAMLEMVVFQCLYQTKLLLTALLSVVFLQRKLTRVQWFALAMLTAGAVIVEISIDESSGKRTSAARRASGLGVAFALGAATISSVAGVYFEHILKGQATTSSTGIAPSLWARNVQLCVSTVPLALLGVFISPPKSLAEPLAGFDGVMWGLVVLNASGGLLSAVVIKYGDNILKNFVTACSVVAGTFVSIIAFRFHPQARFISGAAMVAVAATLFSMDTSRIARMCAECAPPGSRTRVAAVTAVALAGVGAICVLAATGIGGPASPFGRFPFGDTPGTDTLDTLKADTCVGTSCPPAVHSHAGPRAHGGQGHRGTGSAHAQTAGGGGAHGHARGGGPGGGAAQSLRHIHSAVAMTNRTAREARKAARGAEI